MRLTAYYLVSANEHLKQKADESEDLTLLCETFLVESQEGGLRSVATKDDYILRAKIFALLHFRNEYLSVRAVSELFAGENITEELFNKWWFVLPAEDVEAMPTFGSKFKVTSTPRSMVPQTRSEVVNEWLARVAEF